VGNSRAAGRWNHNIEYHRVVLDAVPAGASTALDVGTGDGLLAQELHELVPHVVGLDVDAAVLRRASMADGRIAWMLGDVRSVPLPAGSFDVVASVATLHHLPDLQESLRRLADLTAPGGALVVVGLARSTRPKDWCYDVAGVVWHRIRAHGRQVWDHSAPTVWPPPHSYAQVRAAARRALPGAQWKRLLLGRYSIVWMKPGSRDDPSTATARKDPAAQGDA
jgi:SAM-dependent methyltransferase